jgi:AraC-like DNA-binding protein
MNILRRRNLCSYPNLPIHIFRHMVQIGSPMHRHDFSEIAITTNGRGLHRTGQHRWRITRGDVYVINGDRAHELSEVDDLEMMIILFDQTVLDDAPMSLRALPGYTRLFDLESLHADRRPFVKCLRLRDEELAQVKKLGYLLDDEELAHGPDQQARLLNRFFRLVEYLALAMTRQLSGGSSATAAISKAKAYIDSYYREPLTLRKIADVACLSERSLTRRFLEATGRSPIDYLISRRVSEAARLLREKRQTITETAYLCGFTDSNYFSRQFRRIQRLSPTEYRNQIH